MAPANRSRQSSREWYSEAGKSYEIDHRSLLFAFNVLLYFVLLISSHYTHTHPTHTQTYILIALQLRISFWKSFLSKCMNKLTTTTTTTKTKFEIFFVTFWQLVRRKTKQKMRKKNPNKKKKCHKNHIYFPRCAFSLRSSTEWTKH